MIQPNNNNTNRNESAFWHFHIIYTNNINNIYKNAKKIDKQKFDFFLCFVCFFILLSFMCVLCCCCYCCCCYLPNLIKSTTGNRTPLVCDSRSVIYKQNDECWTVNQNRSTWKTIRNITWYETNEKSKWLLSLPKQSLGAAFHHTHTPLVAQLETRSIPKLGRDGTTEKKWTEPPEYVCILSSLLFRNL